MTEDFDFGSEYGADDVYDPTRGTSAYVELPFPYLPVAWHNGVPQNKAQRDVRYFGGWQVGVERAPEVLSAMRKDTLPVQFGMEPLEFVARNGKEFTAWAARYLYAAPLLTKDDWYDETVEIKDRAGNVIGEERKKRHYVSVLVYLMSAEKGKPTEPWGPAVLSKSGYAGSAIVAAFKKFATDSADARNKYAQGVPVMFFAAPVGTFGDSILSLPAGRSNDSQSIYTPCQVASIDWMKMENLRRTFVPKPMHAELVRLQKDALEWQADTRGARQSEEGYVDSGPANDSAVSNGNGNGEEHNWTPVPPEDDIPF